jgi:hypothetical protein
MKRACFNYAWLVGLIGCSFNATPATTDGQLTDGKPVVDGVPTDGNTCGGAALMFVPKHFGKCAVPVKKLTTLGSGTTFVIDTSAKTINDGSGTRALLESAVVTQNSGPDLLLVASENLTILSNQTVTVVGTRALVLVDTATFTLDGRIIVRVNGNSPGAGAYANACGVQGVQQGDGLATATVAGAGGGGFGLPLANQTLQLSGGDGGGVGVVFGSLGGSFISAASTLVPLRGGCAGGNGLAATAGAGGGAIAIVANQLQLNSGSVVAVPGAGGSAATNITSGGGGGGSGGAIWLEGNGVRVSGMCMANGGGGGAGWGGSIGTDGEVGHITDTTPAAGGDGVVDGVGKGGKGAAGSDPALDSGAGAVGSSTAGGGGGGPGVIHVTTHMGSPAFGGSTFSPPRT